MTLFSDRVPPVGPPGSGRRILTVSELTSQIKAILEDEFSFIWISGEISDFRIPASGHFYFTLKDEKSRIQAVMFKGQNRNLAFRPEDGMSVVGLGRVSVYEPRGTYQILFEILEPKGIGALQVAFEQLKRRLSEEGIFDPRFKKPIPYLPGKIAVITSPTGSVIHDILKVARRRFDNVRILVLPTAVQGNAAETQIVSAIELLNKGGRDAGPVAEVAILARGGGSLEDLQAFNSESVARAIFASRVPIVSGVGHETDFTIADFAADLRAPTPSAAAEIVVPVKTELALKIREFELALARRIQKLFKERRRQVIETSARLKDPQKMMADQRLRLDDLSQRLVLSAHYRVRHFQEKLALQAENLRFKSPLHQAKSFKEKIDKININLLKSFNIYKIKTQGLFQGIEARLLALSPLEVLNRGYSIARTLPQGNIIRDPDQVRLGDGIDLLVARGSLLCRVERKAKNGQTDL